MLHLGDPVGLYRNLAELYYRAIDPVTELVQNSMAAVLERQQHEPSVTGHIDVTVDVSKEDPILIVEDNGVGFDDLRLVGANKTTRDISSGTPYSGFGIGLSAIIARSDYFGIESVNIKNELHHAYWEGVWDALKERDEKSPHLKPTAVAGPEKVDKKVGTRVEATGKQFASLWSEAKNDPQKLYEMILVHTALGHTAYIWSDSDRPRCNYRVKILGGDATINKSGQAGFPFVRVGEAGTVDYEAALHNRPSSDQLIIFSRTSKRTQAKPYVRRLYVACEVARQIIKEKFPAYLESLATHRILLSIAGFPQSFNLEAPPEKATRALWGNILAVVDVDKNVVEPGRNKVSDEYLRDIQTDLKDAIKKLDKLAKEIREAEEGAKDTVHAEEACEDAKAAARKFPIPYALGFEPALKKVPQEEIEVAGLFVELVSHRVIPRTEILALGGPFKVYDQYLRCRFKLSDVGARARPKRSEGKKKLDKAKENEIVLISEFKFEAAGLAQELEKLTCKKRLRQIDLLVCWSEGSLPKGYRMIPLAVDDRFFPAATHRFVKGPKIMDLENSCECVVLEDFLQEVEEQLPT